VNERARNGIGDLSRKRGDDALLNGNRDGRAIADAAALHRNDIGFVVSIDVGLEMVDFFGAGCIG
jgi:hypothetical protein